MDSTLTVVVWHRIGEYSEGTGMARRSAALLLLPLAHQMTGTFAGLP